MTHESKIFVAGHRGLAGSAIVRHLQSAGFTRLLLKTREELDLRNQAAVQAFFASERPEYVFLAAAKVGGILANTTQPGEFIHDNLAIQTNTIHAAYQNGVRKFVFLGSSCIYPRLAAQPIREDSLLTGPLEATNEWYAVAKIAGIKLAQAYHKQYGFNIISLMPTNLYGSGDNFNLNTSHVLPALLRKSHEAARSGAPELVVWGSGNPRREFLHVDDMASAVVHLMEHYDEPGIVNIGTGVDISIRELALMIQRITGFKGELKFDSAMPDGTPRKLLDISRLTALGWRAKVGLEEGIASTYSWFLAQQ